MTDGDLLMVGTSLFRAMPVSDLDSSFGSEMTVYEQIELELPVKDDDDSPNKDDDSDNNNNDNDSVGASSPHIDLAALNCAGYRRLSLVGFGRRRSGVPSLIDVPTDDLHSELYSSTLESLRDKVVESFPNLETMVSRAVIHAFSHTTRKKSRRRDVVEEERQAGTTDHSECMMQQQINAAFAHVRNGKMSPEAAARQISEQVAICGLECINATTFAHDLVTSPREQCCNDDSISLDLASTSLDDDCNDSWDDQIEHNNIVCDVPHLMGSLRDMNIDSNHGESKKHYSHLLLESDVCSPSSEKISLRAKPRSTLRIELRSE